MVDSSSSPSFIPKPPRYYNSSWQLLSQGAEARVWLIPNFLSTSSQSSSSAAICKERFAKSYRHPTLNDTLTKSRTKAEARSICRCRRGGVSVPTILGIDIPLAQNKQNGDNGDNEADTTTTSNDNSEGEGTSACLFLEKIEGCTVRSFLNDTSTTNVQGNENNEGEPAKKKIKMDDGVQQNQEETKPSNKPALTRLDDDAKKVAHAIGTAIGKMHNANIIHGDLTTSNILLRNPPVEELTSLNKWDPDIVLIDFGLSSTSVTTSSKKKQSLSASCHEERAVDLYVLERAFITTHVGGDVLVEEILRGYKSSCKSSDSVLQRLCQVRLRGRKRECFG